MSNLKVGDRVETDKGKGVIAYRGTVHMSKDDSDFCGIILDDSTNGKNNGTVEGTFYFNCPEKHGIFMKVSQVRKEGEKRIGSSRMSVASSARASKAPSVRNSVRSSPTATPRLSPSPSTGNLANVTGLRKPSVGGAIPKSPRSGSTPPVKSTNDSLQSSVQSVESFEMVKEETAAEVKKATTTPDIPKKFDPTPKKEEVPISPTYVMPMSLEDASELSLLRDKNEELEDKVKVLKEKNSDKRHELQRQQNTINLLEENKKQILDKNMLLKRENETLKQSLSEQLQLNETIEIPDVTELKSIIEMLTVDKEIAEENCELKIKELESLQLSLHDKESELKLLKTEMAKGDTGGGNSVQYAAAISQNKMLSDALMKLRDRVAQANLIEVENKQVIEKLQEDKDDLEILTDKQMMDIDEMRRIINDYSEQIDAAAGAEKVIDTLTEKNLAFEDQINAMQDQLGELEELNDMNEALLTNSKEEIDEYRKKLDFKFSEISALKRGLKLREEEMDQFEITIQQFRSKIADLHAEIQNKEDEVLIAHEKLEAKEANDGALPIGINRAFAEIVEFELAKINADFAKMANNFLTVFLPDNFTRAGGDNDALLLTVALPRIAAKADVLSGLLHQKYPPVPGGMRREHITKSHRGEQWASIAHIACILAHIKVVTKKFEGTLLSCSVDKLASICHLQTEFAHHEKTLDNYFELLKVGRFDENTNIEPLNQVLQYFSHTFEVNMSMEAYDNKEMVKNVIYQLEKGFLWLYINGQRILFYLEEGYPQENESIVAFNKLIEGISECEKLLLRTKNHIPKEDKHIMVNGEFMDKMFNAIGLLEKIGRIFGNSCKGLTSMLMSLNQVDGLKINQLMDCIHTAVEKNSSPIQREETISKINSYVDSMRGSFEYISSAMEQDKLVVLKSEGKAQSALMERAQSRKKDFLELESLRWQVAQKDENIIELKKRMKERKDDLQNAELRLKTQLKNSEGGIGSDRRVEKIKSELAAEIAKHREREDDLANQIDEMKEKLSKLQLEKMDLDSEIEMKSNEMTNPQHGDSKDLDKSLHVQIQLLNEKYEKLRGNYNVSLHKNCVLEAVESRRLLGEMKPLVAPNMVAGIYSLESKKVGKDETTIHELAAESNKLNSQAILLKLEGIRPKNKALHEYNVNQFNANVKSLELRFLTIWNKIYPGTELPNYFKRPSVEVDSNKENNIQNLLDKWTK
uniref:Dynactin subunit 1 n=1 Tax=Rhabditophanes sp. KR3021 TaxID=114890 RepID=A0AC35U875_9BILA